MWEEELHRRRKKDAAFVPKLASICQGDQTGRNQWSDPTEHSTFPAALTCSLLMFSISGRVKYLQRPVFPHSTLFPNKRHVVDGVMPSLKVDALKTNRGVRLCPDFSLELKVKVCSNVGAKHHQRGQVPSYPRT